MNWHIGGTWVLPTGYKQMKLKLIRIDTTDNGVFGHLSMDGDSFNCLTLENHLLDIPYGTYKVTLYDSPRWGYKVPLLEGVPGRTMIEIHCGNWETNSQGCILVGMHRAGFSIEDSRSAFTSLMKILDGCDDISLEIR